MKIYFLLMAIYGLFQINTVGAVTRGISIPLKNSNLSALQDETYELAVSRFEKGFNRKVLRDGKEHELMRDVVKELKSNFPEMLSSGEQEITKKKVITALKAQAYNIVLLPNSRGLGALVNYKKEMLSFFSGCPNRTQHTINTWDLPADQGGEETRQMSIYFSDEQSLKACDHVAQVKKLQNLGIDQLQIEEKKNVEQNHVAGPWEDTPQYISLEFIINPEKVVDAEASVEQLSNIPQLSNLVALMDKVEAEIPVVRSGPTRASTVVELVKADESRLTAPFVLQVEKKWGKCDETCEFSHVWEVEVRPLKKKNSQEPRRMTLNIIKESGAPLWIEKKLVRPLSP